MDENELRLSKKNCLAFNLPTEVLSLKVLVSVLVEHLFFFACAGGGECHNNSRRPLWVFGQHS